MSLKSQSLVLSKSDSPTESKEIIDAVKNKVECRCSGRNNKLHHVGDPFCKFPVTYIVPKSLSVQLPVTFDEDLLTSCINRAIAKTPSDFVTMLEDGRVNHTQARRINNELRLMGYCISEEPF